MNLSDIFNQFPDEHSCRLHFKEHREKHGIACKKCGCRKHYWLQNNWQWQCKECNFRTTLKSGTMFQHSNLPLRLWYLAIAFMCFSKKAVSACEMQRQLKFTRYETIWSLMHRIRNIMGNGEAQREIEGIDAFNQEFFTIATTAKIQLKRVRYRENTVNHGASSGSSQNSDTVQSKPNSFYKLRVMNPRADDSAAEEHEKITTERMLVFSTKPGAGSNLLAHVESMILERVPHQTFNTIKRYSQLAIENATRVLAGIYHKVKVKYLQLYLDEFCYKLNSRYTKHVIFDSMMAAVVQNPIQS